MAWGKEKGKKNKNMERGKQNESRRARAQLRVGGNGGGNTRVTSGCFASLAGWDEGSRVT